MNPRISLLFAAVVIAGGMVALWLRDDAAVTPVSSQQAAPEPVVDAYQGEYVLTISWHPAFCETKPNLAECRNERTSDYAADNFSLHGLWPQDDEYCGVGEDIIAIDEANRWDRLPPIEVSDATWHDLQRIMPGTEDNLERHEWVLHGSCAGVDAETYFRRSIALLDEINGSAVRELLAHNLGRHVSRNQVRAAFDAAFGDGAGRKVRLDCEDDGDRRLVSELRINVEGTAMSGTSLASLIHAARNASAGCNGGIVDRVGDQ